MTQFFRRKKFLLPVGFVVLTVAFFVFFFDLVLKWGLETVGTKVNGAKVDIAKVRTSFLNCEIEIRGIEVTNREEPMTNIVQVGQFQFRFLFKQLLSRKVVIESSTLDGIRYGTPRRTSGAVAQAPAGTGPGFFDKATSGLTSGFGSLTEKFSLANLDGLFAKPDLAALGNGENSTAMKKAKEIEDQLQSSSENWKKGLTDLPTEGAISGWKTRADALQKKPTSPQEFASAIQNAQSLKNEINGTMEKVKSVQQTISAQAQALTSGIASLDKAVEQDMQALRSKLKIPSLDFKDITPQLFGNKVQTYLKQAAYWTAMARKYMPTKAKGSAADKKGESTGAAAETGYPKFLLMVAAIQSQASSDPNDGNMKGMLTDVTDNPPLWGKPAALRVNGKFPSKKIEGIDLGVVADHVGEVAKDRISLSVESIPVEALSLAEGGSVQLGIEKSLVKGGMEVGFIGDQMKANLFANFSSVQYKSGSTNEQLAAVLVKSLKNISTFTVRGTVEGTLDNPKVSLTSDLGTRLAQGIQGEFKAKIAEMNAEIRKQVQGKVEARKKELAGRVDQEKKKALGPVDDKLKSMQDITKLAEVAKERMEKEKNNAVKSQISKGADDAKKNIKLPF